MVTPRHLSELEPRERRRALAGTTLIISVAWIILIGVYYALPAGPGQRFYDILRLALGLVFFAGVVGWQTRKIVRDQLPELRAIRSMGVVLPLFLVLFSSLYLSISDSSSTTFSLVLDHTTALYFTITVFATVGFGDIVPKTDLTRIFVSIQMLLDLVIIGVVARFLIGAAKTTLERNRAESAGQASEAT